MQHRGPERDHAQDEGVIDSSRESCSLILGTKLAERTRKVHSKTNQLRNEQHLDAKSQAVQHRGLERDPVQDEGGVELEMNAAAVFLAPISLGGREK